MQYRRLGRSGLKISEVGLGSWLTFGGMVDAETSVKCIERAYELGVNFFDTANEYGKGAAEEVMGPALKKFPRDTYVLATKCFWPMGTWPTQRGLSRKHIMEQCELSLRRLKHDYVDLYQCHRYDGETPVEETLRALDDLTRQGKILYAGVSCWSASQLTDAAHLADKMNMARIVSNQPPYSMLNRNIEREVVPAAERLGISQVVFSPLAQGVLSGKYHKGQVPADSRAARGDDVAKHMTWYLRDEALDQVEKLCAIASELNLTMSQLALAWCLRLPNVSSVIMGATKISHVDDNVGAAGVKLSQEVIERIEAILRT